MIRASVPTPQGSKPDIVISLGGRRGENGRDLKFAGHSAPGSPAGADVLIARAAALRALGSSLEPTSIIVQSYVPFFFFNLRIMLFFLIHSPMSSVSLPLPFHGFCTGPPSLMGPPTET